MARVSFTRRLYNPSCAMKLRVPHKTMHAHAPLFLCAFLMGKCMVVMIYTHELHVMMVFVHV